MKPESKTTLTREQILEIKRDFILATHEESQILCDMALTYLDLVEYRNMEIEIMRQELKADREQAIWESNHV